MKNLTSMDILNGKNRNMKNNPTVISSKEIHNIFKESCEKKGEIFNEARFQKFLKFLEIDFYDWVKENLRQFKNQ